MPVKTIALLHAPTVCKGKYRCRAKQKNRAAKVQKSVKLRIENYELRIIG